MGRSDCCGIAGTSFKAKHWLSIDVCGFFGITVSWSIHIYALAVIGRKLISNSLFSTTLYYAVYLPVAFLAMASLWMVWTTDPGAVPLGARPLTRVRRASSEVSNSAASASSVQSKTTASRAMRRCHKCQDNYKPPRAHHDSVTGRCIVKFDHYCPWVNNAVGALNHKFFCLFLFYTTLACLLSLVFLLIRVIHCGYITDDDENEDRESIKSNFFNGKHQDDQQVTSTEDNGRLLTEHFLYPECNHLYDSHWVLGLFVASIVFLVFTCSMACEQLEAIESGKGKIARMKMRVGQAGTEFETVTESFNEMFGGCSPKVAWHWFVPTKVIFPGSMRKVVLGYEWDESLPPGPYQEPDESDGGLMCEGNGAASGGVATLCDIEMQSLPSGRTPLSSLVQDCKKPDLLLTRASSDVSIPESQKSFSTRNRKSSRHSDDATVPKIV